MKIQIKNNNIHFNYLSKAFANITFDDRCAVIELIKVAPQFRGDKIGTNLLQTMIKYIQNNLKGVKEVTLSPLPLDPFGLKMEQLVSFYEKNNFKKVENPPIDKPYMMALSI
ncbi:MAG: GNAT family N-acetyltransferase [Campylobacterota bacterium]|nr:GNAT family N-acetyltransferase [Campylobacterota bacterium]